MTAQEVLEFAKQNDVKQLDLRFTDIPSLQHHVSYPISQLDENSFEEGFGMDGSSIRGWAAIHESDMLLVPDASTAILDPFAEVPTLVMYGDVMLNSCLATIANNLQRGLTISLPEIMHGETEMEWPL